MNKRQNAAKEQRKTMNRAGAMLTDMQASTVSGLYEGMKYTEELIAAGTRINWKGSLKRAAVDLWDRKENDPDNAPGLWEDIMYKNGIRIIPETITPGLVPSASLAAFTPATNPEDADSTYPSTPVI